jgi:hypothetical protein
MEFAVLRVSSFAVNRCPPLRGQMMTPDRKSCRGVMSGAIPVQNLGKQNGAAAGLCLETAYPPFDFAGERTRDTNCRNTC